MLVITLLLLSLTSILLAQKKDKEPLPQGTPVLWREPTDISSRNLFLGPGGEAMKPDLTKVTFLRDMTKSYSTKYRVLDGAGNEWVVKIGREAQSETAASRLVWAAGYFTDVTYLVPKVEIQGKGTFENARFEARPKNIKRVDEHWDWDKNPFLGTTELQGLKVLMTLMNNWDIQNHNNNVLFVQETNELRYINSDLGATFGKTGKFFGHTRNRPEQYVKTKFINGVEKGMVRFDYSGKNQHLLKHVTVAQAKWIGRILASLSDQQITDAFRAANYSPSEIQMLTTTVRARINELVNLRDSPSPPST